MLKRIATDRKLTRRKDGRYVCKINGTPEYFGRDEAEAYERLDKRLAELAEPGAPTGERPLSVGRLLSDFWSKAKGNHDATGKPNAEVLKRYAQIVNMMGRVLIPGFKAMGAKDNPPSSPLLADLTEADFQRLAVVLNKRKDGSFYRPSTRQQYITIAQMILKYATDRNWLEPYKYRDVLKGPTKPEKLVYLQERGPLRFTPEQIKQLLDASDGPLHAHVLLGINAAYGPTDCAKLKARYIAKEGRITWLTQHRSKTGEPRRCPLWPETVAALDECFPWKLTALEIGNNFGELMAQVFGKDWHDQFPPSTGFYNLRRSFDIIASETAPDHVVKMVMGHDDRTNNMTGRYRQGVIADKQLLAAVKYVRRKVLG